MASASSFFAGAAPAAAAAASSCALLEKFVGRRREQCNTCAVCLAVVASPVGRIDCCAHIFCLECITRWSKINNSCPLCKQPFVRIESCYGEVLAVQERNQLAEQQLEDDRQAAELLAAADLEEGQLAGAAAAAAAADGYDMTDGFVVPDDELEFLASGDDELEQGAAAASAASSLAAAAAAAASGDGEEGEGEASDRDEERGGGGSRCAGRKSQRRHARARRRAARGARLQGEAGEAAARAGGGGHESQCRVCDDGGSLLCCDDCTAVFHLGCLSARRARAVAEDPGARWSCPACSPRQRKRKRKRLRRGRKETDECTTDDDQEVIPRLSSSEAEEVGEYPPQPAAATPRECFEAFRFKRASSTSAQNFTEPRPRSSRHFSRN
jgi:hypothetical protein